MVRIKNNAYLSSAAALLFSVDITLFMGYEDAEGRTNVV